jgi:septation ring formation regulator EzrA
MKRISILCIFCFLLISNSVIQAPSQEKEAADSKKIRQKLTKKENNKLPQEIDKFSLQWTIGKDIQTLEEAEKYLEKLLKQRNILVGDFFGINQTAYRYALVFDRLGYIRYRIVKTDREIKAIKQKIAELRKKSNPNQGPRRVYD